MKARTLFFVNLFTNIYKQRHIFTSYIADNGFAKTVVKDCFGLMAKSKFNSILSFYTIEKKQKLTTITVDTGTQLYAEKNYNHVSLLNHPDLEREIRSICKNFIRMQPFQINYR